MAKCKHLKKRLLWVCHDCGQYENPTDKEINIFYEDSGSLSVDKKTKCKFCEKELDEDWNCCPYCAKVIEIG